MSEIIHVHTRYHYDPYIDLRELFKLAGFPFCYVDEVDISRPVTYIVSPMNGEWRPHIDNERTAGKFQQCNLVLWNIERPGGADTGGVGGYTRSNWDLMYKRHVDRIWVSDRKLAEETGFHYTVLGSHPDFGQPGAPEGKIWDMTHISALNGRRSVVLDDLSKFQQYDPHRQDDIISHNCWPPQRDDVLKKSRFAVNIHQDTYPFSEPLRFALFAAYGLPILSEKIFDAFPYGTDTMAFAEHYDMADTMRRMLNEPYEQYREMGQRCRELMTTEFEFGKMVREAVEETVGGMWER